MYTTVMSYLGNAWSMTGTAMDTKTMVVWMVLVSVAALCLLRYDPH
jgi:hypothetical protein